MLADAAAWRSWLDENEHSSDGVFLLLAKQGASAPTTLTYAQALEEALCSGWIDGRRHANDERTFIQHFTARRKASVWSERNTGYVRQLISQGRMRERGQAEVDRAKADGRWASAYQGQASASVPADLQARLAASPVAAANFAALKSQPRYHILHQLMIARTEKTRNARLKKFITELETDASSNF